MVFPCSICKGEKRACHIDLRHEGCFECASRGHECCLDPDLDMMLKINRKLNHQLGMLDMFRGGRDRGHREIPEGLTDEERAQLVELKDELACFSWQTQICGDEPPVESYLSPTPPPPWPRLRHPPSATADERRRSQERHLERQAELNRKLTKITSKAVRESIARFVGEINICTSHDQAFGKHWVRLQQARRLFASLQTQRAKIEADMKTALGDDGLDEFLRSEELTEYWDPIGKVMVSATESEPNIPGQISWRAFS